MNSQEKPVKCAHRKANMCTHREVSDQHIVDESMQSRWFCSNCGYYRQKVD